MDRATRTRLERLIGSGVLAAQSLGGGHGVRHYRLTLTGGRSAFAKIQDQDPSGNEHDAFTAEADSLRWLGEAGAVPVPAVLASDPVCLVTGWIDTGRPTPAAAATFGSELARLHATGATSFGAPWRGVIAGLPLPNDEADSWPDWYAANRLLPYARIASDAGTLDPADTRLIEAAAARSADVAGPPEPPSRIHGDCWSGNVLWSAERGWLIDPAAHGGHRESDLAMLALFGAPFLDQILATYAETAPLADGWQSRIPLHQLHPLLVHVCLFGGSYRDAALGAARAVLAV
ncbi:MAG TPA: fructosamine kinase family protein [Streptosporangiaceae bacterium]|nr:fructosamine kinase family protein [Streptosporangiaceae bacterium]